MKNFFLVALLMNLPLFCLVLANTFGSRLCIVLKKCIIIVCLLYLPGDVFAAFPVHKNKSPEGIIVDPNPRNYEQNSIAIHAESAASYLWPGHKNNPRLNIHKLERKNNRLKKDYTRRNRDHLNGFLIAAYILAIPIVIMLLALLINGDKSSGSFQDVGYILGFAFFGLLSLICLLIGRHI